MPDHFEHIPDLRSFAFHEIAAEILKSDSTRLDEVFSLLERWAKLKDTQAQGWAIKWRQMIAGLSVSEVAKLIVTKSEQMDFYRKSSPFPCLLSNEQRLDIIRTYEYKHEKTDTEKSLAEAQLDQLLLDLETDEGRKRIGDDAYKEALAAEKRKSIEPKPTND